MSDIQDLLTRLQSQDQARRSHPTATAPDYQEPAVSSPIYSPDPHGPEPHHPSAIMSPNIPSAANTPDPQSTSRTASLLSLLRFNPATTGQAPAAPARQQQFSPEEQMAQSVQNIYPRAAEPSKENRAVSASDLVASFSRMPTMPQPAQTSRTTSYPTDVKPSASSGSFQAQDYLLKLLNQTAKQSTRPTPPETQTPNDQVLDTSEDQSTGEDRSMESPATAFDIEQQQKARGSPFTYVNPFEQLSAHPKPASRNGTPQSLSRADREPSASRQRPRENGDRAETVSQAVSEVGEAVKKEIESALDITAIDTVYQKDVEETQQAIKEAAQEVEQDIDESGGKEVLMDDGMPEPMAEAFDSTIRDFAHPPQGAASRSSSSVEEPPKQASYDVITYNFPMKPFVSITIKGSTKPAVEIRPGSVLEIARLKKEFDQVDRSLIAASQKFIIYAIPKNNGIRVIQQDSGSTQHLFQEVKSRVFNIGLCVSKHGSALLENETILATSIDGNTLWAQLANHNSPEGRADLSATRLVFPPFGVQDDHASAGQIKTRAKPSSRHPEYFAIARGKLIHLFKPHIGEGYVVKQSTRVVAVDDWIKDQPRAIHIGKAGKDFIFSEDDSVIASLDKQGIVKFWDIRKATSDRDFQEVKEPITQFATTRPFEKAWPTSVLFIDKERPYVRGIAQRYLVVGMKQNHTLQLWDLALLKPIQEINLPHKSESDPICKIAYHPKSSTIVVGHPTRNSIYLISVSAPRYNISAMSQAKYLALIAANSGEIHIPESTAIMNSIREISLGTKGQLRSFEILNEPVTGSPVGTLEGESLFELYVLHSKGITAIGVRQDDMGLDDDGKAKHTIDAASADIIAIENLKEIPQRGSQSESAPEEPTRGPSSSVRSSRESRTNQDQTPSRAQRSAPAGTPSAVASTLARVENKQDAARAAIINGDKGEKEKGGDRSERRKKKAAKREDAQVENGASKIAIANTTADTGAPSPSPSAYALAAKAKQPPTSATPENMSSYERSMTEYIVGGMNSAVDEKLNQLYKNFNNESRVQNASNAARHEAVLKMVGSTVAETTEQLLSKVIQEQVHKDILPRLESAAQTAVERSTADLFAKELSKVTASIPNHVRSSIANALNDLDKRVAKSMSGHIEANLTKSIRDAMTPAFANMATGTAQQVAGEVDRRVGEHLKHLDARHQHDALQLDQLVGLVRNLSESLISLTKQQSEMHAEMYGEITKLQQKLATLPEGSVVSSGAAMEPQELTVKEPEDPEIEMITAELGQGKFTDAAIMWLQSDNQSELFDRVFIRFGPEFIGQLSPLVALSISAAITGDLDNNRKDRLDWLEVILAHMNPNSKEIVQLLPKIMDVLASRLQGVYMQLNEESPTDPTLRRLSALVKNSRELKQHAVYMGGQE
ncbi:hypothetical protein P152DRAFT_438588 [Eremomyces bilateralis CBS 781.70]|uniref:EDC4-like protein pdc1 beta-propeller domain-containing protein n=1 Tax=Eremomyces bilateralis CBS 781.70 TaxID=1392243 RepID=A0A6G1FZ06_9PEZI|nr:uncharacterized protein P152DRAFT_438588 [Eremomyces bilateralis CBS 781.70]KAF1810931.1 hypothetical protein P152DRAFT_438588 [Eremomyces bilateralis CBS 781.70]